MRLSLLHALRIHPKGILKLFVIGLVVVVAGLATWRVIANKVDRTNPDAVATAFVVALKGENLPKAASYWVPDKADAWQTSAADQIKHMQSGTSTRFFEGLPAKPEFKKTHAPKAPANEQTLSADGATVDMRQLDGKWYVCKAPL